MIPFHFEGKYFSNHLCPLFEAHLQRPSCQQGQRKQGLAFAYLMLEHQRRHVPSLQLTADTTDYSTPTTTTTITPTFHWRGRLG